MLMPGPGSGVNGAGAGAGASSVPLGCPGRGADRRVSEAGSGFQGMARGDFSVVPLLGVTIETLRLVSKELWQVIFMWEQFSQGLPPRHRTLRLRHVKQPFETRISFDFIEAEIERQRTVECPFQRSCHGSRRSMLVSEQCEQGRAR